MSRNTQTGFTRVELACSTAIVGTLLSAALPAADGLMQRKRLQAVADLVRTDLQDARSQAIRKNSALQVRFESDTAGTCYIVHNGVDGSCRCDAKHQARCAAPYQALKTQWLPASQHVTLSGGKEIRYAAGQGTVTPTATLILSNERGERIKDIISAVGRVHICAADQRLGGLPRC